MRRAGDAHGERPIEKWRRAIGIEPTGGVFVVRGGTASSNPHDLGVGVAHGERPIEKWRRAIGIEPTGPRLSADPSNFEDRDLHQHSNARHCRANVVLSVFKENGGRPGPAPA